MILKLRYCLIILALAVSLQSCRQHRVVKNIYISGACYVGDNPDSSVTVQSKYWLNNNSIFNGEAKVKSFWSPFPITLMGSDILVSLPLLNDSSRGIAAYWKNGEKHLLTDGRDSAAVYAMTVSGNDIYAAGFEKGNLKTIAKYWKNGIAVALTDGKFNAEAHGITIDNQGNVYVCGYETSQGHHVTARYWKNGIGFSLNDGIHDSFASSIAVEGNDVCVGGMQIKIDRKGSIATYWKNGKAFCLTSDKTFNRIKGVVLSDGVVYACGDEELKGTISAKYWKDGVPFPLSDGTTDAEANGIAVNNQDVYVVGSENSHARLWKNGFGVDLSHDEKQSIASCIYLER